MTKKFINHDDNIEDSIIDKSFAETCRLWHEEFHEPYVTKIDPPKDRLFSTKQKIVGALVFPYDIYIATKSAINNNSGTGPKKVISTKLLLVILVEVVVKYLFK